MCAPCPLAAVPSRPRRLRGAITSRQQRWTRAVCGVAQICARAHRYVCARIDMCAQIRARARARMCAHGCVCEALTHTSVTHTHTSVTHTHIREMDVPINTPSPVGGAKPGSIRVHPSQTSIESIRVKRPPVNVPLSVGGAKPGRRGWERLGCVCRARTHPCPRPSMPC